MTRAPGILRKSQNWLLLLGFLSAPFVADAQDIARPSLGGKRAPNPIASSTIPASRYNVKAGPVQMLFNASVAGEYNTNVNVSEDNPIADFAIIPRIGVGVYWPMTKLNRLRFNVQLGWQYYINNPDYGGQTVLIAPDTEFVFNFYVGDVRVTLFDRPSITNNPIDNPSINDAIDYTILNNTAGIDLLWDLNDVQLGLGYNNFIQYALNDVFDYTNRISNQVYANASFLVLPYLRLGLEGSATSNTYLEGNSPGFEALNDSWGYTVGAFGSGNISRNLDWTAGVGWQLEDFNEGNNPLNTGNYSNPYFYLNIDHTLNRFYSHRVTTGFEAIPSYESNYMQLFFVRYFFNWILIRDWSLGGSAFYENATESPGPQSEDFHRLGGTISLNYQLTKHWVFNLYYGVIGKGSTVGFDSYNQQRFGLNATYNF